MSTSSRTIDNCLAEADLIILDPKLHRGGSIFQMQRARQHRHSLVESLYPAPAQLRYERLATGSSYYTNPDSGLCILFIELRSSDWEGQHFERYSRDEDWNQSSKELSWYKRKSDIKQHS